MVVLRLYATFASLLLATAAMTACLVHYGAQRHRTALWLAGCMAGLLCFAIGSFGLQIIEIARESPLAPPPGVSLLVWSALGDLLVVVSLPRFLLSAFGRSPGRALDTGLHAVALVVAGLAVARCVLGWVDLGAVPPAVETLLSVLLFAVVCGGLGLTIVFRSSLPSRSLYGTIIAQLCVLLFFLPVVILENSGVPVFPEFPGLGFVVWVATASISTIVHAQVSFRRSKYVQEGTVSPYFVDKFGLSEREIEVVTGILDGLGNGAIAEKLFISTRTVENHLYRIYQKTGIKNRLQLYNLLRSDTL